MFSLILSAWRRSTGGNPDVSVSSLWFPMTFRAAFNSVGPSFYRFGRPSVTRLDVPLVSGSGFSKDFLSHLYTNGFGSGKVGFAQHRVPSSGPPVVNL